MATDVPDSICSSRLALLAALHAPPTIVASLFLKTSLLPTNACVPLHEFAFVQGARWAAVYAVFQVTHGQQVCNLA